MAWPWQWTRVWASLISNSVSSVHHVLTDLWGQLHQRIWLGSYRIKSVKNKLIHTHHFKEPEMMSRSHLLSCRNPAWDSVLLTPSLFAACFWLQSKMLIKVLPTHMMPLDEWEKEGPLWVFTAPVSKGPLCRHLCRTQAPMLRVRN